VGSALARESAALLRCWQQRVGIGTSLRQAADALGSAACDNILRGYLYVVTTVLSHQDGIYGFSIPKQVFGDLLLVQRSHFSF
jgi:hypothetical protein